MRWSGVRQIGIAYWKIRPFLPSNLRTQLESLVQYRTPPEKQLKKLEMLGESIGLNRKEVVAAYTTPTNLTQWSARRLTPFSACVMILVILVVSFLILALPSIYAPPSTYAWGTRYGSIKPQDFRSD